MFCCGCQVITGAYMILIGHLAANSVYIVAACVTIAASVPTFTAWVSPAEQLWTVGWSMIGIPIIVSAIYGVMTRLDINIRIYLFYLLGCFVVDCTRTVSHFLFQDSCSETGETNASSLFGDMSGVFGEAFLCGAIQIASYFIVAVVVMLEAYALLTIWSVCEEVKAGGLDPELAELLPGKADVIQKLRRSQDGPYTDIIGLAHAKVPGPYPRVGAYDAISTVGIPSAGQTLFGGTHHETNYPPAL